MTDIDLTAAVEAADMALRADNNAADNDSLDESWNREAEIAVEAALPHILAQVEARVTPSRGELIALLYREFGAFLAHSPHNPERFWGHPADAVLALFDGKTEQDVREEFAAEIEARANTHIELADRFGGYHQGIRSALQEAARIARGCEVR